MNRLVLSIAAATALFSAMPAYAASGMATIDAANGGDASEARGAARVFSAGGFVYLPRLLPMGRIEATVLGGAAFPTATTGTMPIGGVAATGRVSDDLNWAVALSPDTQAGIGQRYMASDRWVWAGAYLARAAFLSSGIDYGATYRQGLMYTTGALDLVLAPEASYFMTAGPQLAVALGADYWVTPGVSLGLNYQLGTNLTSAAAAPRRLGAGAKVLLSDRLYLMANGQYMLSQQLATAAAGLGYLF